MNKFTDKELENTINIIESTILNCEKIQPKLKEESSQLSLIKNRLKALYISKTLITNEKHDYTQEEILKSVVPVISIINKSKKALTHTKEGTGTYTRLRKIIDGMTISLTYIEGALVVNKSNDL